MNFAGVSGLDREDGRAAVHGHPTAHLDENPTPPELTDDSLQVLAQSRHAKARGREH